MTAWITGLLHCWTKNRDYGARLVADLSDEQMVAAVAPEGAAPANHPAWVFSHLNAYLPIVESLILGRAFSDPREHPFGMLSVPESDRGIYATKEDLVATFLQGHDKVVDAFEEIDRDILNRPNPLPRWQTAMPTVGHALPYLMLNHENMHLGQISAWRRIQGLPSV